MYVNYISLIVKVCLMHLYCLNLCRYLLKLCLQTYVIIVPELIDKFFNQIKLLNWIDLNSLCDPWVCISMLMNMWVRLHTPFYLYIFFLKFIYNWYAQDISHLSLCPMKHAWAENVLVLCYNMYQKLRRSSQYSSSYGSIILKSELMTP